VVDSIVEVGSVIGSNQMHSYSEINWIDSVLSYQIMSCISSSNSVIERKTDYFVTLMVGL